MTQSRPFSKLKKIIAGLFDPNLKMEFCCVSYPVKSQYGSGSIPRFYLKINKKIIWDYPKDFEIKKVPFYIWADANKVSEVVREYIDTPLDELLHKKFKNETGGFIAQYLGSNHQDKIEWEYKLTELFKAADRRLGKEKLMDWSVKINNPKVDFILFHRFIKGNIPSMSFNDRARWGFALLSMQGPVTLEQARAQVRWLKENSVAKNKKKH